MRRAHNNGTVVISFLSIPKGKLIFVLLSIVSLTDLVAADKEFRESAHFCKFWRQLFHESLERIFQDLKDAMSHPVSLKCPDGQYRHAIFSLGPYISDYPEQCHLACIVQGWCPKWVTFALL
jgi:Plavaka transposase